MGWLLALGVLVAATGMAVIVQLRLRRVGYVRSRRPPEERSDHQFVPEEAVEMSGGVRAGRFNWSVGQATLTVDRRWARIAVPRVWRLFGGTAEIWISRAQVTEVQRVPGGVTTPGVRFASVDGVYDGVVFWATRSAKVVESFERLGWPT